MENAGRITSNNFNRIQSHIPQCLEKILNKKVNQTALGSLEKIVDAILTSFSCFYPAYQRLYRARVEELTRGVSLSIPLSNVTNSEQEEDGDISIEVVDVQPPPGSESSVRNS